MTGEAIVSELSRPLKDLRKLFLLFLGIKLGSQQHPLKIRQEQVGRWARLKTIEQ